MGAPFGPSFFHGTGLKHFGETGVWLNCWREIWNYAARGIEPNTRKPSLIRGGAGILIKVIRDAWGRGLQ